MKKTVLFLSFVFVLFSTVVFAENSLINKICEIDKTYEQGTISYSVTSDIFGEQHSGEDILTYSSDKKYKKADIQKGIKSDWYFDGKDYFEYIENKDNSYVMLRKGSKPETNDFTWNNLSTYPNFCYGRGISHLENATIKDNVVTGKLKGSDRIIKAYIDPQYDYLAYKIECYGPKGNLTGTITNKNPKLIDGKYYIQTNSFCSIVTHDKNTKFEETINIKEATFAPPKESDYTFDWENLNVAVYDDRVAPPVHYNKGELKIKNLDELSQITQERVNNRVIDEKLLEELSNDKKHITVNPVFVMMFSILLFAGILSLLIIRIIRRK